MKIALVDDYLRWGGAVQVVAALHELFPEAPIYTIFSEAEKQPLLKARFKKAKIIESWFSKVPFTFKMISPLRFLVPLIWASFDLSEYDLVISSASWAITKGFAKGKTKEICYCHTPPRYLYGYETSRNWRKLWYVRFYATVVNHFLRQYDFNQAQKVTKFVANSQEIKSRIKKFYRRESVVINPPIEIPPASVISKKGEKKFFLTGGRLEMPKNFDLIIEAFNQTGLPLKIYGTGFQEEELRSLAKDNIEFVGQVGEKEKYQLMAQSKAFIAAAKDEDFGMTLVEAMAAGRPVIAYRGGGYLETVSEGKTGEFFNDLAPESLVNTLKSFDPKRYDPKDCRAQAEKFSKENFKRKMQELVNKVGASKKE